MPPLHTFLLSLKLSLAKITQSTIRIAKKKDPYKIIKMPSYNQEIIDLALKSDLIFADVDGVFIKPWHISVHIANDPYFSNKEYQRLMNSGKTHQEILDEYYKMATKTSYFPVSSELIEHLSYISQFKPVLGLTARSPHFALETISHLRGVQMKFSPQDMWTYPLLQNGIISMGEDPYNPEHKIGTKGDAILTFLQYLQAKHEITPKQIFFIDDSRKNLEDVSASLKQHDIQLHAVHYTEAHEGLRNSIFYSQLKEIAALQRSYFITSGILLSNKEAMEIIKQSDTNKNNENTRSQDNNTGTTTDTNNDEDLALNHNPNYRSTKSAPTINTYILVSSLEEELQPPQYDETNSTQISELAQKHYEDLYGDLKLHFDEKIETLDLLDQSKSEDDSSDSAFYLPEWLSAAFVGLVVLVQSQMPNQQHISYNDLLAQ